MPSSAEIRARYAAIADEELLELAARPQDLTSDAQAALAEELQKRRLSATSSSPRTVTEPAMVGAREARKPWHRGWITVFEVWVTLIVIAFVAGFVLYSPGVDLADLWLLALLVVPMTGLVLIAKRNRHAPLFWRLVLGIWLMQAIGTPLLFGGGYSRRSISTIVQVGAWLLYWLRSRRAAREFQSDQLTEVAA